MLSLSSVVVLLALATSLVPAFVAGVGVPVVCFCFLLTQSSPRLLRPLIGRGSCSLPFFGLVLGFAGFTLSAVSGFEGLRGGGLVPARRFAIASDLVLAFGRFAGMWYPIALIEVAMLTAIPPSAVVVSYVYLLFILSLRSNPRHSAFVDSRLIAFLASSVVAWTVLGE